MNKTLKYLLLAIIVYFGYCAMAPFDKDSAVKHLDSHALSKSHCCCAWYVMRAIQAGGIPIGILPAWGYEYALPFYGFANVTENYDGPKKGDIVVFPATKGHIYGHIAMYNGNQWVSDFKQKNMICSPAYKNTKYKFYRNT